MSLEQAAKQENVMSDFHRAAKLSELLRLKACFGFFLVRLFNMLWKTKEMDRNQKRHCVERSVER